MAVEVLVKHKQTGDTRTISYQSYKDTKYLFDLIGEVDEKGGLIPGSPNLQPRQPEQKEVVADPVVKLGQTLEERQKQKDELTAKYAAKIEVIPPIEEPPQVEQKKRGPKPKLQTA